MSFPHTTRAHTQIAVQHSYVKNNTLVFVHNFDKPLDDEYELMLKYPSLRFENDFLSLFDHPIFLTHNLQEIYMGYSFNNLIVLNPGLRKLSFGFCFNKPVALTYNLTHVAFKYHFDQPIILTPNIQYLIMETHHYSHSIILNKQLVVLVLKGHGKNRIVFSKNLKSVTYHCVLGVSLIFSKKIVYAVLSNMMDPIIKFSKKIQCVKLNGSFYNNVLINKNALSVHLKLTHCCTHFPKSLKNLTFGMSHGTFKTTKNLNYLCLMGVKKTYNVIIEHSITKLSICFDELNFLMDNLPNSIKDLKTMIIPQTSNHSQSVILYIENPPSSLK